MAKLSIIVAATENNVIGRRNDLPWHLPTDMKYFKKVTDGSKVIMGRKCWESIPEKFRPLPNRKNFVVTRQLDYEAKGAIILNDTTLALSTVHMDPSDEVFVIGGAEIYKEAFKYATKLYLTRIEGVVEGDVILEGLDINEWDMISSSEPIEENGFKYKFEVYQKKDTN
jgi:dihydrofolate reductase